MPCLRSSERSPPVIAPRSSNGWTPRSVSQLVRSVAGRRAKLPTPTSFSRSVTTSTPVTRRFTLLRRPTNENWSTRSSQEALRSAPRIGAEPNRFTPLHRAVRNRCSAAADALIEGGADPRRKNKSGSTPLHLAVQDTGKSDSGSQASKDEQGRIIAVLLRHGANPTDVDAKGRSVAAASSSDWVRQLLDIG
jgi:hypothetical protein